MTQQSPYEIFAEKMLHKDSVYIPKILRAMITDEQADILVSMPGSAGEIADNLGRDQETVFNDLNDLYRKGLAFKKEKEGVTLFRPPMHIVQFHDATIVWPEATEEFYLLWQKYMEEEWPALATQLTRLLPRPFTRVVPVNRSVETGKARVLAPENIKEIIEKAERLAVTKCTCRLTMRNCDAPLEVCIQINKGADYTIDRGSGREITKKEAFSIVESAQEAGLVHVTMNKADVGHFICNCCGCCCQSFTLLISDGVNLCDPSRYLPSVDTDICTGCGTCEERCWFDAIMVDDEGFAVVNAENCLGCGQCAISCPEGAVDFQEIREPDFIPE